MLMGYRQYARHCGRSLKAVQKAIATGRIQATAAKKIDSDLADAAWTRNTDPSKAPAAPAVAVAAVEVLPLLDGEAQVAPAMKGLEWPEWPGWKPAEPAERRSGEPIDIRDFAAARARREAAMAEMAEIELAEKRGTVLALAEAQRVFYGIGKVYAQVRSDVAGVLKTALVGMTDPREIEAKIRGAFAQADERVANEIQARFADVADALSCSAG